MTNFAPRLLFLSKSFMAGTNKFLFILILCCGVNLNLFYNTLYAQQTKADSLLAVVNSSPDDSNKANTLNLLAWEMVLTTGDYEKTMSYANEAIVISEKIKYKKGHSKALKIIGAAYMLQGDYPEAIVNFEASLKINEEMGDKKGIAAAYSNIGLVYMYQGDYANALKNHKKSLKMEEEIGDKTGIAQSYNNIGIVYEDIGNYPEALNNYLASLRIKEEIGDKVGGANTLSNIGAIKEIQGNYKEALGYHNAALKLRISLGDQRGIADCYQSIGKIYMDENNYGEALKNLFTSLKIYDETGNKSGIASSFSNIGLIYYAQGDSAYSHGDEKFALGDRYPKALTNYIASLKIREEIGDKGGVAASYINLGAVNIKLQNYAEAKKYLNDGLKVSMEIGNKKIIKDSYLKLSILDSLEGNIGKAYADAFKKFADVGQAVRIGVLSSVVGEDHSMLGTISKLGAITIEGQAAGEGVNLNINLWDVKSGAWKKDASSLISAFESDLTKVTAILQSGDRKNIKTYLDALQVFYQDAALQEEGLRATGSIGKIYSYSEKNFFQMGASDRNANGVMFSIKSLLVNGQLTGDSQMRADAFFSYVTSSTLKSGDRGATWDALRELASKIGGSVPIGIDSYFLTYNDKGFKDIFSTEAKTYHLTGLGEVALTAVFRWTDKEHGTPESASEIF